MILNGKKLIGWLAGLALCPVLGFGQEFLVYPQNTTVCAGESTVFEVHAILTEGLLDSINWFINEDFILPDLMMLDLIDNVGLDQYQVLTISYNKAFNGTTIQGVLRGVDYDLRSETAYLFYESNQQFLVTDLTPTITNTTARFDWNAHNSNLTTSYLFGVYDSDGNLIANQTTDATQITYELPPRANDTCQYLEFRVSADQCPDPDNGFIQDEATSTSFIINCPTAETEVSGEHSGTPALYPSLLLTVAAMVPLLRIARPAF